MDPQAVIENARGDVDEGLLTRTDAGILDRNVLADAPLVAYLDSGERLQYLLSGAAAPVRVVAGERDSLERDGSYRTLLAVTDGRLLVVAGGRTGDRSLSFPYDSITSVERDPGLLTDTVTVRESPDRHWEVPVSSGSDPAAAVAYAAGRVAARGAAGARDPVTVDDPPRDAARGGSRGVSTDGEGAADPGRAPDSDADDARDDDAWSLPGSDDAGSGIGPDGDGSKPRSDDDVASDADPLDPSFRDVELTDVDFGDVADGESGPGGALDGAPDRPDDPSRDAAADEAPETPWREGALDGARDGRHGGDGGVDAAPTAAGRDAGSDAGRSGSVEASTLPAAPDGESDLVTALYEKLVADVAPSIRGGRDVDAVVAELRRHDRQLHDHIGAGDLDGARRAAATVDGLAERVGRLADERGRSALAERAGSVRVDVRRTLVAAALDVDLQDDLDGGFGPAFEQLLRLLDPEDFEHVVADLWSSLGYRTTVTGPSGDRGVDVVARRSSPVEQTVLVQAERYGPGTTVGSEEIQQYASLHRQEPGADLVVVVTTGSFSGPAREVARDLDVELVDGDGLVGLLDEAGLHDVVAGYLL